MPARGYQTFAMQAMAGTAGPLGEITNRQDNSGNGAALNPYAKPFVPHRLGKMHPCFPSPAAMAPSMDERPEEELEEEEEGGASGSDSLKQASDVQPVEETSGSVEGASHSHAEGEPDEVVAKQPALPMQSTLGQWLRTCASATDLEVASMLSMAPSMVSTTEGHHAAPGSQRSAGKEEERQAQEVGVTTAVVPPVKIQAISNTAAKSTGEAEPAQWTPRSCKAFRTSEDGASPRTCVTSVAEPAHRLPKWARGLEALQSPQLQALAQQWQQQQAHLSSIHLHPHEEEQDAELRFLEDNSTAFEDQDAPAEQERPQPQEDQRPDGETAELSSSSVGRHGLLSQALQAAPTAQAEPTAQTVGDIGRPEAEAESQDTRPHGNTVARLVRHWQHHPISLPPVSKLRLDRSASAAEPTSSSACGSGRYVTPVVLSKVQHYLDTSSPAPTARATSSSSVRATAASGDSHSQRLGTHIMPAAHPHNAAVPGAAAVATESSMRRHDGLGKQVGVRGDRSIGGASCWSTVTQAERTQWWGKGTFFSEKRR